MTVLHMQEIAGACELCLSNGSLNPDAVGWSRQPRHVCNLSGHWPRKKRWNYWCITSDDFLFAVAIGSLDYAGSVFAYFLDFKTKQFQEDTVIVPFGKGIVLPQRVESDTHFANSRVKCSFVYSPGAIALSLEWPSFKDKPLKATIEIRRDKSMQSLNVVVPWGLDQFQFTSKQPSLPALGTVQYGDQVWTFQDGGAFACLDFGRGIWPRTIEWNWASFWTRSGNDLVAFNAGAKWTKNTGSNENGVVLNGKLHKFHEPIEFIYDASNFIQPWILRTLFTDSVDLIFTPFFERVAKSDLWLVRSETHQLIGRFEGILRLDEREIPIHGGIGWAEDHNALW